MSYLGRSSEFGVRSRFIYTAAGSETSITGNDDSNNALSFTDGAYVDVYLNGVLLVPGADYNTNTANMIGGLAALAASDVVEVVAYDTFQVADTVPASTGGTFNGNITANAFYGNGANLTGIQTSPYDQTTLSTGFFALPSGTTAQRPGSPAAGYVRHNTDDDVVETYNGTDWVAVGIQAVTYDVDYLVVGGGAAGGTAGSGSGIPAGGGAGGYQSVSSSTLTNGLNYSVVIGAGGVATAGGTATLGDNGNDSSFSDTTSIGGGGGSPGSDTNIDGASGASGGGGGGGGAGNGIDGGAGTSGQGNAGGTGSNSPSAYGGGGGGGAGAVGSNGTSSVGGNGGNGTAWVNGTTYAGGGGGGAYQATTPGSGGSGGGGAGANQGNTGTSGTANKGGGGGAGGEAQGTGGSGGSGVVIIRYSGSQIGSGGTVTSSGGYTYHTFTSSGSYTA